MMNYFAVNFAKYKELHCDFMEYIHHKPSANTTVSTIVTSNQQTPVFNKKKMYCENQSIVDDAYFLWWCGVYEITKGDKMK